MPEIYSIVYKPRQTPERPPAYLRQPVDSATLVAGYGIEGDRKGGSPKRQLNLLSYETVEGLRAEGFHVAPGELGEQIVVRGLVLEALAPGARLRLGDSAIVEVVDVREPCDRFERAQGKPREQAENRIGVMARVIEGGRIHIGDAVAALPVAVEAQSPAEA